MKYDNLCDTHHTGSTGTSSTFNNAPLTTSCPSSSGSSVSSSRPSPGCGRSLRRLEPGEEEFQVTNHSSPSGHVTPSSPLIGAAGAGPRGLGRGRGGGGVLAGLHAADAVISCSVFEIHPPLHRSSSIYTTSYILPSLVTVWPPDVIHNVTVSSENSPQ